MKYTDGRLAKVGDTVLIDGQYLGLVVVNIDADEYSTAYPSALWSYLRSGVLVDTDFGGLVHYQQESLASETIELVRRAEGDS